MQFLSPILWRSFNLKKYDLIISSSAYSLCNLINSQNITHIKYIHSIPKNLFGMAPKYKLQKLVPFTNPISHYYRMNMQSSNYVIANSRYTQKILRKLFNISSTVIYPPVSYPQKLYLSNKRNYFLIISRLDRYKKIEHAIEACNTLRLPLVIAGVTNEKSYERYLKKISGPTVQFIGWQSEENKNRLYRNALGFIFTGENEDFGIAPIEAMSYGIPVISFYGGGPRETVKNGITGVFFYEPNIDSLIKVLKNYNYHHFNPVFIHDYAKKFSGTRFIREFSKYIRSVSPR